MVKTQSAIYAVRDALAAHLLLETTALGVGAVKDGEVRPAYSLLFTPPLNLPAYHGSLLLVAVGGEIAQPVALFLLAVYLFGYLPGVVGDKAVGGFHYAPRAAIVAFQLEEPGTFVSVGEVEYIVDIGTTEGIDALRVIAHHANTLFLLRELPDDLLLGVVGVLVLIHKHEIEKVDILPPHVPMVSEEAEGVAQQVVKVHGVGLQASSLILLEDVSYLGHPRSTVSLRLVMVIGILSGGRQAVLGQ